MSRRIKALANYGDCQVSRVDPITQRSPKMIATFDKNGVLIKPPVHDGNLLGIRLLADKSVELTIKAIDAQVYKLIVPGLERLRTSDFCDGNIIFEITAYSGGDCPSELVQKLYGFNDEQTQKHLRSRLQTIIDEKWTLLELTSSYGCELLALSRCPVSAMSLTLA